MLSVAARGARTDLRIIQLKSRVADVPDALLVLGEASFEKLATRGGVGPGSTAHTGSRSRMPAITSELVSPPNGVVRQHLVEHAPKRPDVGPPIDRSPARLLGAHVPRRCP